MNCSKESIRTPGMWNRSRLITVMTFIILFQPVKIPALSAENVPVYLDQCYQKLACILFRFLPKRGRYQRFYSTIYISRKWISLNEFLLYLTTFRICLLTRNRSKHEFSKIFHLVFTSNFCYKCDNFILYLILLSYKLKPNADAFVELVLTKMNLLSDLLNLWTFDLVKG